MFVSFRSAFFFLFYPISAVVSREIEKLLPPSSTERRFDGKARDFTPYFCEKRPFSSRKTKKKIDKYTGEWYNKAVIYRKGGVV